MSIQKQHIGNVTVSGSGHSISIQQNAPCASADHVRVLAVPRDGRPTRTSLRDILAQVLRTSADFDGFCLDYFPDVYRRFSDTMDRVQRENLLLQLTDSVAVLSCLSQHDPAAVSRCRVTLACE